MDDPWHNNEPILSGSSCLTPETCTLFDISNSSVLSF